MEELGTILLYLQSIDTEQFQVTTLYILLAGCAGFVDKSKQLSAEVKRFWKSENADECQLDVDLPRLTVEWVSFMGVPTLIKH